MKNSTILAIASAITGCVFAGSKLVNAIKKCHKESTNLDEMEMSASSSYEDELTDIQYKHDAEMAALDEMDKKNKAEHNRRMTEMKKVHDEKISKMEEIRKELLKNAEMYRFATPNEARKLEERDMELLRELREM